MPVDADLLSEAKAAQGRTIDAERNAEVARADFHHAVRRLHLAGASLREVAAALGLSHQRVHQIVEAAGGGRRWRKGRRGGPRDLLRCSFCGRTQGKARTLVAGPDVYVCEACLLVIDGVFATGITATTPAATIELVSEQARTQRCSFCGKRRHQVPSLAAAGDVRICTGCLRLCHQILAERLS
jgi:ClpX C4-type zinc finger